LIFEFGEVKLHAITKFFVSIKDVCVTIGRIETKLKFC
jgi:hypothetical protein